MSSPSKLVSITFQMNRLQAIDLAVFCKRVGFLDFENNSQSKEQAYRMRDALQVIENALDEQVFDRTFNPIKLIEDDNANV